MPNIYPYGRDAPEGTYFAERRGGFDRGPGGPGEEWDPGAANNSAAASAAAELARMWATAPFGVEPDPTNYPGFFSSLHYATLVQQYLDTTGVTAGWVLTADGAGSASWEPVVGGSGFWGTIGGTLSDQTDLNTELTSKYAKAGGKLNTGAVLGFDSTAKFESDDAFFSFRPSAVGSATLFLEPRHTNNTTTFTAYSYDRIEGGSGSAAGDNASVSLSATGAGTNHLLHVDKHNSGTYAKYKSLAIATGSVVAHNVAAVFGWDENTGLNPYATFYGGINVNENHSSTGGIRLGYRTAIDGGLLVFEKGTSAVETHVAIDRYNDVLRVYTTDNNHGAYLDLSTLPSFITTPSARILTTADTIAGNVAADTIWDVKGDLVVGTGSNTATRLAAGTDGHVLTADSSTATGLKWAAGGGGGTPGGSDTQIQFNDGGSFGGDASFLWDKTNNVLTLAGNRIFSDVTYGTPTIQSGTTNASTSLWIRPNGTSRIGAIACIDQATGGDFSYLSLGVDGSAGYTYIDSLRLGSGSAIPLVVRMGTGATQALRVHTDGNINIGTSTSNPSAKLRVEGLLLTDASDTSEAGLRLPHGSAPTSPVDGDLWTTTAGMYARINGTTVGPFGTGGGSPGGSNTQIQFNDSGAFGGDADFTWDKTNNVLTIGGTGSRVRGDFSASTVTDRLSFQTTTTNSDTVLQALPNGTSTSAAWRAYAASSPVLASPFTQLQITSAYAAVASSIASGSALPFALQSSSGGTTYFPITVYNTGNVRISNSTGSVPEADPSIPLFVGGRAQFITGEAGAIGIGTQPSNSYSTTNAVEFGAQGSVWAGTSSTNVGMSNNLRFLTSTNWTHKVTGAGSLLSLVSGTDVYWQTAPSATAGAAATITNRWALLLNSGQPRMQADFSASTWADRLTLQTITANSATSVMAAPNGTATSSGYYASNQNSHTNCGYGSLSVTSSEVALDASRVGSGTSLPLVVRTGNTPTEAMRVTTDQRVEITSGKLNLGPSSTPASASDTGTTGDIRWDTNYVYICVGTNTWKRAAIATW